MVKTLVLLSDALHNERLSVPMMLLASCLGKKRKSVKMEVTDVKKLIWCKFFDNFLCVLSKNAKFASENFLCV